MSDNQDTLWLARFDWHTDMGIDKVIVGIFSSLEKARRALGEYLGEKVTWNDDWNPFYATNEVSFSADGRKVLATQIRVTEWRLNEPSDQRDERLLTFTQQDLADLVALWNRFVDEPKVTAVQVDQ